MNTLVRIAWRNVVRHKRRAIITAVTMMAGIGIFIAIDSMMNGLDRVSVGNLVNLRTSSVKVFTSGYDADRESLPLDHGFSDVAGAISAIKREPLVAAVTRRTEFLAQAGNYRDALPVLGVAIDPSTDQSVFALRDYLTGRYLTASPAGSASAAPETSVRSEREVIIGKELAGKLHVGIGDTILLSGTTRYSAHNADDFTVVGLLSTSDPALNTSTVFIAYDAANRFLDLDGLVTELDVRLEHRINLADAVSDANRAAARIDSALPGVVAKSFTQLDTGFLTLLQQKRAGSFLIIVIILLIAAVGIVNTVLMSVYERIREVGVLRALGFERRDVLWMFTFEALFVGLLGSVLGAALGILLDAYLIVVGIPLDKMAGGLQSSGFAFWGTLYGEWNPGSILFAVLFGLVISLVAGLIPARRASRMTATAALRFV